MKNCKLHQYKVYILCTDIIFTSPLVPYNHIRHYLKECGVFLREVLLLSEKSFNFTRKYIYFLVFGIYGTENAL